MSGNSHIPAFYENQKNEGLILPLDQPSPFMMGIGVNAEGLLHIALPSLPSDHYATPPLESPPESAKAEGSMPEWLIPWDGFVTSVVEWFLSPELKAAFKHSKDIPVGHTLAMQQNMVNRLPHGGDRGIHGTALYHLALPGADCFSTLQGGSNPLDIVGGEAYVPDGAFNGEHHPAVIFKSRWRDNPNCRIMVGRLKLPSDVNLGRLESAAEHGIPDDLKEILESMARYLPKHGVLYGFISTWEHTVFLKLGPRRNNRSSYSSPADMLLFSPPIPRGAQTVVEGTETPTISVMLGLVYLLFQATEEKPMASRRVV